MEFNNGHVTVDRNFVRVGSKSYAVDKIGSIDIRTRREPASQLPYAFWLAAAVCVAIGVNSRRLDVGLLALVLAGVGFVLKERSRPKVSHSLVLLTTAGETQAFESSDMEEICDVRDAIEAAMVSR